jgi:hypothetical protein
MVEIDIAKIRAKWQQGRDVLTHYKGKQVATYNPDALPLERRALIEAEEIMQRAGAGAMFSVYRSLAERYKSLIILLPVAQSIDNTAIAQALQTLQLVACNAGKIYCLSWFLGIPAKKAKAEVAEMFSVDAEKAVRDVREMLTYSLHLVQVAQREMQAYQASPAYQEKLAEMEIIETRLNYPESIVPYREEFKRNIPNGGADMLSVEDERIYNFITSAYARPIADSQGAYTEHQRWKRELLLLMGEDSADSGGVNISL